MDAKFALIQLEDNLVMSVDVYETYEDAVAERYECQKSLEEDYPNSINYFYYCFNSNYIQSKKIKR